MNQKGLRVTVKDWESIDKALRRFKKKVNDDGRLEVLKSKEYYETGAMRRKREKGQARSRYLKALEKANPNPTRLF